MVSCDTVLIKMEQHLLPYYDLIKARANKDFF